MVDEIVKWTNVELEYKRRSMTITGEYKFIPDPFLGVFATESCKNVLMSFTMSVCNSRTTKRIFIKFYIHEFH
jgi:hypothetical protein